MNELLVLLAGVFLAIMIAINGLLNKYLSVWEVSFIVHFIGMILLMLYIKFIKKEKINILGIPMYLYFAGVLGVSLVSLNSFGTNLVGVTLTIALSLSAQIITSTVIDHFGFFGVKKIPFHLLRIPSFAIMFLGLFLIILN